MTALAQLAVQSAGNRLAITGTLLLALTDAVTKGLGETLHPFELSFFRYAVAMLVRR